MYIYYIYIAHNYKHMADNKDLLREFLAGGWLVAIVGAAGMIARLLTDDTKATFAAQLRKITVASVCSVVAWFLLENVDISSLLKAIIYGVIGVISPEIVTGLVKLAKMFADNPKKIVRSIIGMFRK